MNYEKLKNYKIIKEQYLDDVKINAFILEHIKTKAKVICMETDDNNKVFTIGFRTPPKDDCGVAHIIEHTVLCGSKKYPAKDPFIELVKGSLNTFLNAMTYPDKTVYPVASCNDKDFQNLMDVYMDAVFNPNIYKTDNIFKQEGWHYEIDSEEGELTINGVVYNEMKGVYSSPEGVMERSIMRTLYPDTCYGCESGGDPDFIPDLTYEDYLDFHRKYYHPSNSYIYLYGDMDMAQKLEYLHEEYLSNYDYLEVDSKITEQPRRSEIVEETLEYPITDTESLEDNTVLSYNLVIDKAGDEKLSLAIQLIDYALLGQTGAPLKQALIDKGIGKDISSSYEGALLTHYYSITAEKGNADKKDEFYETIISTLEKIYEEGINKKSLEAAIDSFEFNYREMDFGRYPKGLMFCLRIFDTWLYDENPFSGFEGNKLFKELRELINTDYYNEILKKYLIDNKHASLIVNKPVKGLAKKREEEFKAKLQKYKESLNSEEIQVLIQKTKELNEYQTTPSSQEDLEKIPLLSIDDISKDVEVYKTKKSEISGVDLYKSDYYTNGISYMDFIFDITSLPYELYPYLGILKETLSVIGTKNYSYDELCNEILMSIGSMTFTLGRISKNASDDKYINTFETHIKCFDFKIDKALELTNEVINRTIFDDKNRLREIIAELKSRKEYSIISGGDEYAKMRATSYFSKRGYESDLKSGIAYYKNLEEIEKNFDEKSDELIEKLKTVCTYIFRKENMLINFVHEECDDFISNGINKIIDELHDEEVVKAVNEYVPAKKNEAFMTSSQVQYVAMAGKMNEKYKNTYAVLRTILSFEYLWNNIRVTGGAYGCGCNFFRNRNATFSTYRDPNLNRSIEIFKNIPKWVGEFDCSDRDMTKYIIGTISNIDAPLSSYMKGVVGFRHLYTGISLEKRKKNRFEILSTNVEKIRELAGDIQNIVDCNCICVVGSQSKIEEEGNDFDNKLNLFE